MHTATHRGSMVHTTTHWGSVVHTTTHGGISVMATSKSGSAVVPPRASSVSSRATVTAMMSARSRHISFLLHFFILFYEE